MTPTDFLLRPGRPDELDAINAVVERAVMTWRVPERVKRLALPGYRYSAHDFEVFTFVVAEAPAHGVAGVAAVEPGERRDLPEGATGVYLHGLYVDPAFHRRGVGARLFAAALDHARRRGVDGVLVKAQRDAERFFRAQGMRPLEPDAAADYPRRYWMALAPPSAA
ncbi:MAG TPA: GNAT family N-acetyltransferase [Pelomicrobium sp.]|nr:GNAT family N-acetyltransferase [Pelomicrobium sp.]